MFLFFCKIIFVRNDKASLPDPTDKDFTCAVAMVTKTHPIEL